MHPFSYVHSFMEVLSFLGFIHSCWPPQLTYFLLTVLFAGVIIDVPADCLLHPPSLLPNTIHLFEPICSFSHFSKKQLVIPLLCSKNTSYPIFHSTIIFLILILCTLTFHIPFATFPIFCLTAIAHLPSNPSKKLA